jgi:CheY-like chemotaxis protein
MTDLAGLRALVVEDEAAVALLIEDMLSELGCEVIASVARLAKACVVARTSVFDFAVLDLNLAGEPAFPVADILRERQIPFVFSTGYGTKGLPADYAGYPALAKPFVIAELRRQIVRALDVSARFGQSRAD